MRLAEGLERNALEYLVSPLISIDEFESKIDDRRVIVCAFFVKDLDPAHDLSVFIEKSSIRPLDTEVSPAPTDEGYYVVFVEMGRNDEFPKRVVDMADQVSNLCDVENWQFKPYGGESDATFDLEEKLLREYVNLDPNKVEIMSDDQHDEDKTTAAEAIGRWLGNSLLESIEIRGQHIRISDGSLSKVFKISDWRKGPVSIPVLGLGIGDATLRESMALQRMLGNHYQIDAVDDGILLSDGDRSLILTLDS